MTRSEKIASIVVAIILATSIIIGLTFGNAKGIVVQKSEKPSVNSTVPIDLSGVDWIGLARLVYGRCGEWHDLAMSVGWTEAQWPKLSYVIYRESRCNIGTINKSDPNGGSRGLMQINGYWCRKNKYNPSGWLQAQGTLNTCDDLFNPEVNLRSGLAIWNYSQQRNKCGWRPWATRC